MSHLCVCAASLCAWACLPLPVALAASPLTISTDSSAIVAREMNGQVRWRVMRYSADPISAAERSDGAVELSDGTIISRIGRIQSVSLLGTHTPAAVRTLPSSAASPVPLWSDPVDLFGNVNSSSASYSTSPAVFDGSGRAFIMQVQTTAAGTRFQLVTRADPTSPWSAPQTFLTIPNEIGAAQMVADTAGNLTVLYREFGSSEYVLKSVHYETASGWGSPVTVYSGTSFFQDIRAAATASGDVVAIIDQSASLTHPKIWSYIYSAGTKEWSAGQQVTPSTIDSDVISFAASPNGSHLWVASLDPYLPAQGVFAQELDLATHRWSVAEKVPGSTSSYFILAAAGTALPLVVDDQDVATVLFPVGALRLGFYTNILASRYEQGRWTQPATVLRSFTTASDISNFFSSDITPEGDVIVATPLVSSQGVKTIQAFQWSGGGWTSSIVDQYASTVIQDLEVRWTRTAGSAVCVYRGPSDPASSLLTGTAWSSRTPLPNGEASDFLALSRDNQGQMVLLFYGKLNPEAQYTYPLESDLLN